MRTLGLRARVVAAAAIAIVAAVVLLALLLRNARGVVTRELALEEVWGGEGEVTMNAVDRYVAYVRRKLGDPPLIHTVRGIGFRLDRADS